MWFATLLSDIPFRRPSAEILVRDDADALMKTWGDVAYRVAADLSWREDIGLLQVSNPGHWMRVTLEIGRRTNMKEAPRFDADVQSPAS